MLEYLHDQPIGYDEENRPIYGNLYLTLSAAETLDREGKFWPFRDQENFLSRVMEMITYHGIDVFADVDHALQFETEPTINDLLEIMPRVGDGPLGPYFVKRAYTVIEKEVAVAKMALKLLTMDGYIFARELVGVSLSGFGTIYKVS